MDFILQGIERVLKHLFLNHSGNPRYNWVKTEFYLFIAFSGAVFLVFKPTYLLMLLLPIISKMCYDDPAIWSIDCHYSIEFAPVITLGLFLVLNKIKPYREKSFYTPLHSDQ